MPKRKKGASATNVVSYHSQFSVPTADDRKKALGDFPSEDKANETRIEMLTRSATKGQPSLLVQGNIRKNAINDLDCKKLFTPTGRSETSYAIPKPHDELDWLAQVPEQGQTFDDYLSFLTTRKTGRIRPIANPNGIDIVLLPIVRPDESRKQNSPALQWPDHGPSLELLVDYTKVFFDRPVRVLPAAELDISQTPSTKKAKISSKPGAFASAIKGDFKLILPQDHGKKKPSSVGIVGRRDYKSDRIQLQVTSLLDVLSHYRLNEYTHKQSESATEQEFCIVGITMEDLYDGPSDLFCAGMAFGGDKVAVFSFKRYHPFIKMHPFHWSEYGYGSTCDGYSYYEDGNQNPMGLSREPPVIEEGEKGKHCTLKSEYLRRSSKLLTHELGHLYALDHCIHNRCLMMGTGHLVEDFRAPSHLCGVCLRKLQWRTGFDVRMRYHLLTGVFIKMGMKKESLWCKKQYENLSN